MFYELKETLREKVIDFCFWLLKKAEPCKNECLSCKLHKTADEYSRRPTGDWD